MNENDAGDILAPPEPVKYDDKYFRDTLRLRLKRLGIDHRDEPAVDIGIENLRKSRYMPSPDGTNVRIEAKDGRTIHGESGLDQLARELAAAIQDAYGPGANDVIAAKKAHPMYTAL